MRIGFIGAGKNAQTMARLLVAAGHEVVLSNARGPDTLAGVVADLGPGATAGTREDAVATALVILAVNWPDVPKAVEGVRWEGRILVDATNAHAASPPDLSPQGVARSRAALGARTSSEIVAERTPGARVVKAISNMPMAWIEARGSGETRTAMFVAGDDSAAKAVVLDVLDQLGFAGVDLGSLARGGAMFELGAPLSGLDLKLARRLR